MPFPFTTWSTAMRKLFAVCRRPAHQWAEDLIVVLGLFALIPLIMFLGGAR